ncbi:hypothetical protein ACHAXA_010942 [Cyclostephanos tholiformis]|uniref:Uncharacterized protein n=1 Tax=Cyclostephanos tholiformis TaxID=382380 RepID=A0ABD3R6V2_9STRA
MGDPSSPMSTRRRRYHRDVVVPPSSSPSRGDRRRTALRALPAAVIKNVRGGIGNDFDYRRRRDRENDVRPILQPDAIYEERYGDAYVDGHINYLYPTGYQSMRPRSGPWRLSVFVFVVFACLDIFVVGHCYDRGVREYYLDGVIDDTYLRDVDDDDLVMETRWCGSRPLYLAWMVCVWITVLSMSYCSIIGYVKVRDFVVANGRSQPPGMIPGTGMGGRSDYYLAVDSTTMGGDNGDGATCPIPQAAYAALSPSMSGSDAGGDGKNPASTTAYSSYQDGMIAGRYVRSIYQSDGTPQFWGGHIYRPTQAAAAMTNRP